MKKQPEKRNGMEPDHRGWAEDGFEKQELENKSEFGLSNLEGSALRAFFARGRCGRSDWRFDSKEKPFLKEVEGRTAMRV